MAITGNDRIERGAVRGYRKRAGTLARELYSSSMAEE